MSNPKHAPPPQLMLLEGRRALWEMGALAASYPLLLRMGARGDGHPVLVLPGLTAADNSTSALRRFLNERGYSSHGWGLGPNLGPRPGVLEEMHGRLAQLAQRHQRKVSLIGWSLGGIFARELARQAPQHVRSVISLGSPFAGAPGASNASRLYASLNPRRADDEYQRMRRRVAPPVPTTAIYSRSDGVVAWQGCRELPGALAENIEVEGSHCGLGHNPAVLYAIADRLAQPEGNWRAFERSGARALFFRDPYRDEPAMPHYSAA